MASKKAVTVHNLAALGSQRLAVILFDLAGTDAEVKRRLRLELAAQVGGDAIAAEIGKRITALRTARSFVDWLKRRDFVRDLDLQRARIEDTLSGAKSARYKHAARHLLECSSLESGIGDFGTFESHETFASRLHAKHGRKVGFWAQVAELSGSRR